MKRDAQRYHGRKRSFSGAVPGWGVIFLCIMRGVSGRKRKDGIPRVCIRFSSAFHPGPPVFNP